MNRYSPIVFMAVGLVITAGIGGAVAFWEVDSLITNRLSDAGEGQSDKREQLALSVTTDSSLVVEQAGSSIRIRATVENPHDSAINPVIALRIDGDQDGKFEMTAGKRSPTVSAGAEAPLEFTVPISRLGPGAYEYAVGTADGSVHWATGSFGLQAATFAVKDVGVETVVRGETASITASISNVGDFSGNQPIEILVDRNLDGAFQSTESVTTEKVSIAVNSQRTVTFEVPTGSFQPGQYPVRISTKAATMDTQLGIKRPATLRIDSIGESRNTVPGEPFELRVHVTNVGDVSGNRSVSVTGLGGRADDSQTVSLGPGNSTTATFSINTTGLRPGYYQYEVSTSAGAVTFPARLLRPPTFEISSITTTGADTPNRPLNVSVSVTNVGHLTGNQTVTLTGPSHTYNRTVELGPRKTTTINFTVDTDPLAGGNYTFAVRTQATVEQFDLRVRAAKFEVTDLSGAGTYSVGDEVTFSARLRNIGNAKGAQEVELRIDLDDDDAPESLGIGKVVSLAPDERTTISFTLTDDRWRDAVSETSLVGTHIFGIFSDATNATGTFVVRPTSTSSSGGAGTNEEMASRDEISQEKYGLFYSELSGETQAQVDEIYTRQPFARDLVVTQVMTREEIARQQFGHDVEPGEPFDFTALHIQVQQQAEATFDAQFTTQRGDRIESWDELARMKYGQPFDELTAKQQEVVRNEYQDQFDDTS